MKRLLLCLILICLLTACGPVGHPVTGVDFIDDSGVCVSIPYQPKKVAVLLSSYAEIWQLAGGEVAVTVGESVERGIVNSEVVLVDDGAGKTIDLERLVAQEPDFVLCSADIEAQQDCALILNAAGIPAVQVRVEAFEDYLTLLRLCCTINGNDAAFEQYGTALKTEIDAILAAEHADAPQILFLRAGSSASSTKAKSSADHFAATMLAELGAENLADSVPVLLDGLSLETILMADPDAIFVSTMGIGAAFAAVPLGIYQGSITLLARFIQPYMSAALIGDLSFVGSVIITGVGINLIFDKGIKVANMLPAILGPVLYHLLLPLF